MTNQSSTARIITKSRNHEITIIANYNKRKHSTTKLPPNDLARNALLLDTKPTPRPSKKYRLPPVGSHVRLNRLRGLFDKEASDTWTEEVFQVVRLNSSLPIPLVYVQDLMGAHIQGGLYPEEYQYVKWNGKKDVEKVLKERKLPGKPREWFVAYKGWPKKFNAWVRTKPVIK